MTKTFYGETMEEIQAQAKTLILYGAEVVMCGCDNDGQMYASYHHKAAQNSLFFPKPFKEIEVVIN